MRKTDKDHWFRHVGEGLYQPSAALVLTQTVTSQLYCHIMYELSVSQETHCLPQH